ncbi:MAG: YqaA family protein [Burkholderiales bacterium]|jgi:membrane protein YqaA with SNARE-associated domain
MESWLSIQISALLTALALPQFGLTTLFLIAFLSATLLPMGSEPAVIGLVSLNHNLFWPAIGVATLGNTLGGAVTWWMGLGAHQAYKAARPSASKSNARALQWLQRFGPKACLLSWLPIIGDPLCAVAGWLKFPLGPCLVYMAIGKFARYLSMTGLWYWGFVL